MLPPESIRLFDLDRDWISCLQAGAFSIGPVSHRDDELYSLIPEPSRVTSGILLRSEIISGWPGLLVSTDASLLSTTHISKDTVLCLFDKPIRTIEFYNKQETTCFGVTSSSTESTRYYVPLNRSGQLPTKVPIPWQDERLRVIYIEKLAKALRAPTSAELAFQMLEPVETIKFNVREEINTR